MYGELSTDALKRLHGLHRHDLRDFVCSFDRLDRCTERDASIAKLLHRLVDGRVIAIVDASDLTRRLPKRFVEPPPKDETSCMHGGPANIEIRVSRRDSMCQADGSDSRFETGFTDVLEEALVTSLVSNLCATNSLHHASRMAANRSPYFFAKSGWMPVTSSSTNI